ncbi:MFS family permease [Sporomusaceae bacterium BoRhaA]|uniref:MFS transporter n=1 Tax=Pelorhabdus rhamnosifermentans TaxID=2772457 RepID=UPI001C061B74|nr:MFS transporter [Pelorhabdus rhamnosifermentans]MBU2700028.1 MFS family permease [Pelorhabdus rhamnosifermentans]
MLQDKALMGVILAVFLMMIGVGMIVAILPQRIVNLDGNGQSVGYLASAFAFSYILFQIPIGNLSDRLGFKPFLLLGYSLCCIAGLAFFFAPNSSMIFFARVLQGIGEAPIWALAPALLSLKFPLSKGKVMGLYNAAIHFGLTLGPLLGVVLANLLDSKEIFLVYSVNCLSGVIVIYFLLETIAKKEIETITPLTLQDILKLVKQQQTLIALLGITIYGAGYGIFLTTIPAFLLQEKAFSAFDIGIFFSLFYAAISLSQVITGPLSDKFGQSIFMILGLFIAAIGIAITPAFEFPLIFLVLTIGSLGMGIFYLASMAFLNESTPNSLKGTISGAYYLFWGAGMFFGPPIITQIATSISFQTSMTCYSLLMLLVAIVMLKMWGWKTAIK